jgi:hypothetical protein
MKKHISEKAGFLTKISEQAPNKVLERRDRDEGAAKWFNAILLRQTILQPTPQRNNHRVQT